MGTTLTGGWSESAESLVFFRGKEADDGQQSTDDSGAVRTPKEEERRQLKPANFTAGELQFCASQEELKSLQDLFVEGCCSLYHDILDCLNDDTDSEVRLFFSYHCAIC
uniref:Uncharacterized protein n=1 Tax=Plectus sambesii TaxID=2011161 RepID=A0A914WNJ5_9BILA